ncbi:hypothetical protein [Photobacterium sp. R1]
MFKKKLSVVMLVSLGLFGCGSDDDKKAVKEIAKPAGLNVQVEFYNEIPSFENGRAFRIEFLFDLNNSGDVNLYEEGDLFFTTIIDENEKENFVSIGKYRLTDEAEIGSELNFPVTTLGYSNLSKKDGKSVFTFKILNELELVEFDSSERKEKMDTTVSEYERLVKSINGNTPISIRAFYWGNGVNSGDYIGRNVPTQRSILSLHDSKDDYEGDYNYVDIESATFTFN